jgi:hypothetical protein
MQKLILSILILGFAAVVQAGETKTSNEKEKAGCCSQKAVQAKASTQATGGCCSMDKTACKQTPVRQVLISPKAAAEYAKK